MNPALIYLHYYALLTHHSKVGQNHSGHYPFTYRVHVYILNKQRNSLFSIISGLCAVFVAPSPNEVIIKRFVHKELRRNLIFSLFTSP